MDSTTEDNDGARIGRDDDDTEKAPFIPRRELSVDKLRSCLRNTLDVLQKSQIDLTKPYWVEFGLKKWKFSRGGHRAVIIKVKSQGLAFRLDLVVDSFVDDHQASISGTFTCPQLKCKFKTESFRAYTRHFHQHVREKKNIIHNCCGKEYNQFPVYCKHLYDNHRNYNAIGFTFEKIDDNKKDELLSKERVSYFPSGVKQLTFMMIIESAIRVLKNFGKYFVFFWNCQDYATWFLTYQGIPLAEIEPTLTDQSSGSGSESTARCIRNMKEKWYLVEPVTKLEIAELGDFAVGYICHDNECKYLPPMDSDDLEIHEMFAHAISKETAEEARYHACRAFVGIDFDEMYINEIRTFSLYRLRQPFLYAHDSIVIQPWSSGENPQKMDHFCRLHVILDDSTQIPQSTLKCEVVRDKEKYLEHIFDFSLELNQLYIMYSNFEAGSNTLIGKWGVINCSLFCNNIINMIWQTSTVTNESLAPWHTRIYRIFASLTTMQREFEDNLPFLILASRTCESASTLIAFLLLTYSFLSVFFNGDLRFIVNELRYKKDLKVQEIIMLYLSLICHLGLIGLAYQGITSNENISCILILYHTWICVLRMQEHVAGVTRAYRVKFDHNFSTLRDSVYKVLFLHCNVYILLCILYVSNVYIYLIGNVLIVIMIYLLKQRFDNYVINLLSYKRFKWFPFLLYISILIAALFFHPQHKVLETYNRAFIFPYLLHYSYWVIQFDIIDVIMDNSLVEDHLMRLTAKFSSIEAPYGDENIELISCVKSVSKAMRLLSFLLSKMKYFYILMVVYAYIMFTLKGFLISFCICFWLYCFEVMLYVRLACNFKSYIFNFLMNFEIK